MNEFNPNELTKEERKHIWGTYIPTRRPNFKTYYCVGHAMTALKYRARYSKKVMTIPEECTLWKHNGSKWVEVEYERTYKNGDKLKLGKHE